MKLKNLLKGVVRAAGALVGSQIGGPAGAALGAGLATKLTGGSSKDALLGGLVSGIGSYGIGKFGGKLGLSTDGMFGAAPAGAGGDMGYINSEAGGQSTLRGIGNFATSTAGLAALGAGALALGPGEAPPAAAAAPARDTRTLEDMGYDTTPLQRTQRPYQGDPYAYGETGGEQRYFARGGHVRRGIAHYDDGGYVSLESITDAGYDPSSVDASGGVAGALSGTGYDAGATADSPSIAPAPVDFSVPPGIAVPATQTQAPTQAPQNTSIIGRGLSAITDRAQNMMANPGRTGINAVASAIPVVGPLNTLSGLFGGPTIGGLMTGAIQDMTNYNPNAVRGDADNDGTVTTGDDYANYGGPQYDPSGYGDGVTYMEANAGGQGGGPAAPPAAETAAAVPPGTPAGAGLTSARGRMFPLYDPYRYGEVGPEARFYAARGGLAQGPAPADMAMAAYRGELRFDRGGKVSGPGDGQSDDIPAMLSDGEYVMDADTVASIGNGSNEAGAKKLDVMRKRIRAQKRRAPSHKIPPKARGIGHYMGGRI